LLTHGNPDLNDSLRAALQAAGISLYESPVIRALDGSMLTLTLNDDSVLEFDALYVGFGVQVHSQLAVEAGAKCGAAGYVCVDQTQQTTVPGLYAAGDLVQSLSQISVAFGQAAVAASAINSALNNEGIRATPA
jgi:thioredoxin reductase (NADPH)